MMHLYYLKMYYPTFSCYPKILPIHSLSLSIHCVFTGKNSWELLTYCDFRKQNQKITLGEELSLNCDGI